MPYERRWNPLLTEPCAKEVQEVTWPNGMDNPPVRRMIRCPDCSGRGYLTVGGIEEVWVDPPSDPKT